MSTAETVHECHQPSGAAVVHGCFVVGHTKMIAGDHLVDFMSQLTMFLEKVVGVSFACHHHSGGAIRKKRCINNCRIAVVNGEATAIDQVFQRCWGDNVHGDRCRPRRKDELQCKVPSGSTAQLLCCQIVMPLHGHACNAGNIIFIPKIELDHFDVSIPTHMQFN